MLTKHFYTDGAEIAICAAIIDNENKTATLTINYKNDTIAETHKSRKRATAAWRKFCKKWG